MLNFCFPLLQQSLLGVSPLGIATGVGILLLAGGLTLYLKFLPKAGRQQKLMPIRPRYRQILEEACVYYQQLQPGDQRRFALRVQRFILLKRFIPRQMPEVTSEMKVLIAAAAVQLTFGLPHVYLRHFRTILIYPDSYFSTISKKYHKGEVNPFYGVIVLSWRAFVEGILHPADSMNLGLHEMAHALRLENLITNGEFRFFDPELLDSWETLSARERLKMTKGTSDFFRSYARTDEEEFFAIAVENFFERPRAFRQALPDLYGTLSNLLKQDPAVLFLN